MGPTTRRELIQALRRRVARDVRWLRLTAPEHKHEQQNVMSNKLKSLINSALQRINVGVTRYSSLQDLRVKARESEGLDFILDLPEHQASQLLQNLRKSKAQLRQDLFVLSELNFKRGGYFVEFGAADGLYLSNTYLLEKEFGWAGVLAEPAGKWHTALKKNRSGIIDTRCVWSTSGVTLNFKEVDDAEYSTIDSFAESDSHLRKRRRGESYQVQTVSLNELLGDAGAPCDIDYLSIDTEGSEFEILSNFDFERYNVKVITCEHNFTPMREKINALLTRHGYTRVYESLSRFDDWYVRR